jgi:hypothetical protein
VDNLAPTGYGLSHAAIRCLQSRSLVPKDKYGATAHFPTRLQVALLCRSLLTLAQVFVKLFHVNNAAQLLKRLALHNIADLSPTVPLQHMHMHVQVQIEGAKTRAITLVIAFVITLSLFSLSLR